MIKPWESLLEFETRDLIDFYYQKRHQKTPNATKIKEISANFAQAREYFKNYENANLTVQPLLLYYGILALSRGLVLFSKHEASESSLKPSHGLEVTNWQKAFSDKEYLQLEIKILNGAFTQLLEATNNKTYFYANSSRVNWQVTHDIPAADSKILFFDLLRCFPDLNHEFEMATTQKVEHVTVKSVKTNDNNIFNVDFSFEREPTPYEIEVFYKEILKKDAPETIIEEKTVALTKFPFVTQKWSGPFNIGDAVMIRPLPNNIEINDIGKNFIAAYILGMLARYFPSTWISIGRTEKGDKVYPLIVSMLRHLETRFPLQVLDFLKGPYKFE